jgi:hypothetical protein
MNYIKRDKCVITEKKDLEPLYKLINFPVFIGCTEQDQDKDLFADMEWSISKGSGVIQLTKLLPLNLVYSGFHSEAVGNIWEEHRKQFSDFIIKYTTDNSIVEMGGSNGSLAELCLKKSKDIISWTIIEPNPDSVYRPISNKITVIESFIEDQLEVLDDSSVFVHSHVLEHLYSPLDTMTTVSNKQSKGDLMIFSIPDLYEYLSKNYANTINFEHTYFLTECVTDYLLKKLGYKVRGKYFFKGHSIFYCAEYIGMKDDNIIPLNNYKEYKVMYLSMIEYYKHEVESLNIKMINWHGEIYLFGAHIFSQFLIHMGLDVIRINGIIDNSKEKQGKRLYGTTLSVSNPNIITHKGSVMTIVKAGQYQDEVEGQLYEINKNVHIVR